MVCVKRTRIRQVALRYEDIEATPEALVDADIVATIYEPKVSFDVPSFERAPARADLSKEANISGARLATITFQSEVKGGGAVNTKPGWSELIQACGFAELRRYTMSVITVVGTFVRGDLVVGDVSLAEGRVLKDLAVDGELILHVTKGAFAATDTVITGSISGATADVTSADSQVGYAYEPFSKTATVITIGAVTGGPFQAGEELTAPSGAEGRVIRDIATGATQLYFQATLGTFANAEVITGSKSGAFATSASIPSCANPTPTVTIWSLEDGVLKKIKGARGKVKLTFPQVGEPSRFEWELTGVPLSNTPEDGLMLTDPTDVIIPPKFQGAVLTVGAFSPVISNMEITVENELAARFDATDGSGYISVLISNRALTGSFDPEMVAIADNDYHGQWFNDTLLAFNTKIGAVAGNQVEVTAPALQYTGVSDEDRDGIALAGSEFMLSKGISGDDEILLETY